MRTVHVSKSVRQLMELPGYMFEARAPGNITTDNATLGILRDTSQAGVDQFP